MQRFTFLFVMKEHMFVIFAFHSIFKVNSWVITRPRAQQAKSIIGPVQGVLMDFDPLLNHESIHEKLVSAKVPYEMPEGLVKILKWNHFKHVLVKNESLHYCRKKSGSIAKEVTKKGIESETLAIDGEISQYEEKPNSDKGKGVNDLTDYMNLLYYGSDEENLKEYADSGEDYDYIYTDQSFSDSFDSEEYSLKDYLSILYPEEEYSY